MEHELRLVITKDSEGKAVMILTNDFNITAEESFLPPPLANRAILQVDQATFDD